MGKTAFLFPGQASQHVGMGRELAERYEAAAEVFRIADKVLGFPISELCFEGKDEELCLTPNLQPAVLAVSVAVLRVVTERTGLVPDFAAGHSLGEYTAYVSTGALDLADAVSAVRNRGLFMQEAVPAGQGGMAAVIGLDAEDVLAICSEIGSPEQIIAANFNGASQVVISGLIDALDRATVLARDRGARRVARLNVSAPFHSPMMEPARTKLAALLSRIPFRDPRFPVVSNVDARPNTSAERIPQFLADQVTSPVLWEDTVNNLVEFGVDLFIEIGPGKVLTNLARRTVKGIATANVEDVDSLERLVHLLEERVDGE